MTVREPGSITTILDVIRERIKVLDEELGRAELMRQEREQLAAMLQVAEEKRVKVR